MSYKKIISVGLSALACILGSCQDTSTTGPITSKAKTYGTFRIELIPENLELDNVAYTSVKGTVLNGPVVPEYIFKEETKNGECVLFKRILPNCADCNTIGYKCIADGNCATEPDFVNVGTVTVSGLKYQGQKVPVTIQPPASLKYQMTGVKLDYPCNAEGDTLIVSATGSDSAKSFSIKIRGIAPLVVHDDPLELKEGQPITVNWDPPSIKGISTITIRANISYHGGNNGEIRCETEDDGSFTIPADMMDKLVSYGIAGYPCVYVTRKSVGIDENSNTQVIEECTITKVLTIPGKTYCNNNPGECPTGQECIERMCK